MSSCSIENQNPNTPSSPWSTLWSKNKKVFDHAVFSTIRRRSFYRKPPPTPRRSSPPSPEYFTAVSNFPQFEKTETLVPNSSQIDYISQIPEATQLRILSEFEESFQKKSNSLVSKSWLNLQGSLVRSIRVFDWGFVVSGRMFLRFPNLIDVDLVNGIVSFEKLSKSSSLFSLGGEFGPFCVDSDVFCLKNSNLRAVEEVDLGLRNLSRVYPTLQRLVVINCSEIGLLDVAENCSTLQELALHCCNDQVLRAIAAFDNLQILKLSGTVDGFYSSLVSDIGLTILAQGCKRLVKLELRGCEGSYDGIKDIC
uniref:F-box protein At5g07670-like n=1 Tax=Erigeron canadensis TaxID=72917 RepID=UPI001CB88BBA|nr:F-box protein At5g07670-like [Erigeron canadensis]